MVLCFGIRCNRFKIIIIDDTNTPALHLFKKTAGFYTSHEHDNFKGFDVRARGDHVHGNSDPRIITVSEFCDQVFRLFAGCLVGNLLGKVIALGKFLAHDFNNIFGMAVIFCKNQGLWHIRSAGENLCKELVPKGADNSADLVCCNHITIKLVCIISKIFIQLFPADLSGFPFPDIHIIARLNRGALFCNPGPDTVNIIIHIHPISNGFLMPVFHHKVLIKKTKSLFAGRGSKANNIPVKIIQHLAPEIINRAVTFVCYYKIKGLNGNGRVVFYGRYLIIDILKDLNRFFLFNFGKIITSEHGVKPLDRADADPGGFINYV